MAQDIRIKGSIMQCKEGLVSFSKQQTVVLNYFLRNFAASGNLSVSHIDRRCQMYTHGIDDPESSIGATFAYFDSALKMLHPLRTLVKWKFGSFANCNNVLDFASGFGRLTRFLVGETGPDKLFVSDIQLEALEFQRRHFGVRGIPSVTEPDTLSCAHKFDCIFVASLFTHLPEHRFVAWLSKLVSLLTPRGMLVFSVHDTSLLERHRSAIPQFLDFNPNVSEIASLEGTEYGSTHASPRFVNRAIEVATSGKGNYHRIPRGLWHHDLYIYTPDGSAARDRPGVGILGPQNALALEQGRLVAYFSDTDPRHRVTKIGVITKSTAKEPSQLFEGDGRFSPNGWQWPLYAIFDELPQDPFDNDIVVRAESSSGEVRYLPVFGTLEPCAAA